MNIREILWRDTVIEKLDVKHGVEPEEVEQTLENTEKPPKYRFIQKGDREGEHVYMALGQTEADRYLAVILIFK